MTIFTKYRFQTKLFFTYSIVIVLIILIALISFYYYTSSIIEKTAVENLSRISEKATDQLDFLFRDMDKMALQIASNPTIIKSMSRAKYLNNGTNYFDYSVTDAKIVEDILISINGLNLSADRISLYDMSNNYISIGKYPGNTNFINDRMQSDDFYKFYNEVLSRNGKKAIFAPRRDYWSDKKGLRTFMLLRELRDPYNLSSSYGIVEITKDEKELKDICQIHSIKTYLISEEGDMFYPLHDVSSKNQNVIDFYLRSISNQKQGVIDIVNPESEKHEIVSFYKSDFSKLFFICVQTKEELFAPIYYISLILITIGIIIIGITLSLINIISRRLTLPLVKLTNSMKNINIDNLHVDVIKRNTNNEIIQLNNAFNSMFKRVENSMSELIKMRSHEMKAHMIALQSQMDPHFLYNIITIISAYSHKIGDEKIVEICNKLSNMLRYITSYEENLVPIRDEVEHSKNYLELMKVRFEDQLSYNIEVDENLYKMKIDVPKLILQPLVENCFNHGFKDLVPPWKVSVSVWLVGRQWFIKVSNNGNSFTKDELERLIKQVEKFIEDTSTNIQLVKLGGMGLVNILVRLKLVYKDNMFFKAENDSSNTTNITIGGNIND
jgi:two-component system sensor histidine kinase YesM